MGLHLDSPVDALLPPEPTGPRAPASAERAALVGRALLDNNLQAVSTRAYVEEAFYSVPVHVALQLQLEELEKREVTLADGSKRAVSYVGPIQLRVANRNGFTGAMVLGNEVLLGAIPMEDPGVAVLPRDRRLDEGRTNPNTPASSHP